MTTKLIAPAKITRAVDVRDPSGRLQTYIVDITAEGVYVREK